MAKIIHDRRAGPHRDAEVEHNEPTNKFRKLNRKRLVEAVGPAANIDCFLIKNATFDPTETDLTYIPRHDPQQEKYQHGRPKQSGEHQQDSLDRMPQHSGSAISGDVHQGHQNRHVSVK